MLENRRDRTFARGGAIRASEVWRAVGGRATQAARSARLASGRAEQARLAGLFDVGRGQADLPRAVVRSVSHPTLSCDKESLRRTAMGRRALLSGSVGHAWTPLKVKFWQPRAGMHANCVGIAAGGAEDQGRQAALAARASFS